MNKFYHTLLMVSLLQTIAFAQVDQIVNEQLRANFAPNGATTATSSTSFIEVQEGDEWISLLFESGLLIAGVTPDGETKLYGTQGEDIEIGIEGIEAEVQAPWRVTREQVSAHLADFEDNGVVDNPIPEIFAWPGLGNRFSEEYNGHPLSNSFANLAPFWDQDGDGIYDPDQGDYPILAIRGCVDNSSVPSEMMFYPILIRDGEEVFFKVFLTAFRYDCFAEGTAVNNTIFLHYQVINSSELTFEDTYLGYFADGDLGCFADDYLGVFPDQKAVYFYNAQEEDASCDLFEDQRFTGVPAAVGLDLLRGPLNPAQSYDEIPLTHVMPILNGSLSPGAPPAITEPVTVAEYYNYLSGRWRDGQELLNEGDGYESGEPTDLAFTGDPLTNTGWTELDEGNEISDRKAIFSTGPFTLERGAINEFTLGITFSKDPELNHLEQVGNLRNRLDDVQQFFDNCFEQGDAGTCAPLITSSEDLSVPTKNQLHLYPNPTRDQVSISLPEAQEGTLRVFSANGQVLLQKRTFSELITLDVQTWPRGLYLLRWQGEKEVLVNKLLVD
ncbi:MAG: T9SS type A sorting domain-containing protein [Bacteroidota bacterium]